MILRLDPYLVLDGTSKQAIQFYEKVLGAEVTFFQTFGEMPENSACPVPDGAKDRVMHAALKIGESSLMFSDTFPGQERKAGDQVTLCVSTNEPAQSRQIFDALQEGGHVNMPLQETFFSPAYGIVTDKFGVTFQIYTAGKEK